MKCVHYFSRKAKHINDVTYNNEVHQLCASIELYLNWPIFKVSRSSYLRKSECDCPLSRWERCYCSFLHNFSTSHNYECNEMKSKNTTLLEQFQNQISKSQKGAKRIFLSHKQMTTQCCLFDTLQCNNKVVGLNLFYGPKPPLLVK